MGVRLIFKDGILTAVLSGEIDHHAAREIRNEIDETAAKLKPKKLIFDFSAVQFMDSSGIGLIMGRYRLMKYLGGTLRLVNVPEKIEKLISLAGLGKLGVLEKEEVKTHDAGK